MAESIKLLDCTLRDGAYIVEGHFGTPSIRGIIHKLQDANVDLIECGWLKNPPHCPGTSYYQVPDDLREYLTEKNPDTMYVAMIDWDRYELDLLPEYDGNTIDAVRVVFPVGHFREGIAVGKEIQKKGYTVFFQAANTLAYSDDLLRELAEEINGVQPKALSIVDTFGAMYEEDLERIVEVLDDALSPQIALGFHSHNNQQLSFALSMRFVELLQGKRELIIDASLCGMGRGAGNATTELVANYLNRKQHKDYDMNAIMDAIDLYMNHFQANYQWGYSTPYFIAGMYGTHVNNIAYLTRTHHTSAADMRNIIETLSDADRKRYDYDLLEQVYVEHQNKKTDDSSALVALKSYLSGKKVMLIIPGKSVVLQEERISRYIEKEHPLVVGVNAILPQYKYDYLFFSTRLRYDYAKEVYSQAFRQIPKMLSSNVKTDAAEDEFIINYSGIVKRGWEHFDNACIICLRLLRRLHVRDVILAGFDGFEENYDDSYADTSLTHISPGKKWGELNDEIREMFEDVRDKAVGKMTIHFLTRSKYAEDWMDDQSF